MISQGMVPYTGDWAHLHKFLTNLIYAILQFIFQSTLVHVKVKIKAVIKGI